MQKFLIDGYNLIHADPGLKRLARGDMQAARRRLVDRLADYVATKRARLTVVFDGAGGLTDAEAVVPGRLQCVFSAAGETADALIVQILERAPNPREYVIVTSDMSDIGRNATSLGATVIPSQEFARRIAGRDDAARRDLPAPEDDPVDPDVDYWLEQFEKRRDRKDRDGES